MICTMGIIHIAVLLFGTSEVYGVSAGDPEDIKHDYCRYKFFITPMTWEDAQKVCNGINRTLAKVANTENLTAIVQMASTLVYPRISKGISLASELWIGLRVESNHGSLTQYWEDCDSLDVTDVWFSDTDQMSAGCVAIKLSETNFTVNNCSNERPFICEASNKVSCYKAVDWTAKEIFSKFKDDIVPLIGDCVDACGTKCIAFQTDPSCLLLTFDIDATGEHSLNARSVAYTIGYIDLESPVTTDISPSPSMTCFQSMTPSKLSTSSQIPLTTRVSFSVTSSKVMDSTISSQFEGSMTSSRLESVVTSTGLEGSMTSWGLGGTTATPPLTMSLTSVELEGSITSQEFENSRTRPEYEESVTTPNLKISVTTSGYEDVSSLHSSSNETVCMCPCSMVSNTTYSPEELERRITEIREKLTIDRKKTSVYKRSLISAPDESISVRSIGYVGVAALAAICAVIVLMDLPKGVACLREFINKCR